MSAYPNALPGVACAFLQNQLVTDPLVTGRLWWSYQMTCSYGGLAGPWQVALNSMTNIQTTLALVATTAPPPPPPRANTLVCAVNLALALLSCSGRGSAAMGIFCGAAPTTRC